MSTKGAGMTKSRYYSWEHTPLGWHKFNNYIRMPVGLVMAFGTFAENNANNYFTTYGVLGYIDLVYCFISVVIIITAFAGCLPGMRKWYGPIASMASEGVTVCYAIYGILVSIYLDAFNEIGSKYVGSALVCTIILILETVYYRKRRFLFYPVPNQIAKESNELPIELESISAPLKKDNPKGDEMYSKSSVDLLRQILDEEEQRQNAPESVPAPVVVKKGAPRWLCICLSVALVLSIAGCAVLGIYSYNISDDLKEAQFEVMAKEEKYQEAYKERSEIQGKYNELLSAYKRDTGRNYLIASDFLKQKAEESKNSFSFADYREWKNDQEAEP